LTGFVIPFYSRSVVILSRGKSHQTEAIMAPEEILSSADASRRDFLKKVLVGTTFAVPVVASFSMEGLSPESASAGFDSCSNATTFLSNQCSNQATSECCRFAAQITIAISEFGSRFCGLGTKRAFLQEETLALLLGPLGRAQAAMAEGLEKGKGECTNKPSRDQFKKAGKELGKFKELVDALCDSDTAEFLNREADALIAAITDLQHGNCSPILFPNPS
jgi:hypothetical protein